MIADRTASLVVLLAFAQSLPANASPIDTVIAADECPATAPNAACIKAHVYDVPLTTTEVVGRLNGGPVSRYRLQQSLSFQAGTPYLGQSPGNHAIILTTHGPLEIRSKGWRPSHSGTYLVDEKRWKIVARFLYPPSGDLIVTAPNDIGIWDDKRQLCISARLEPRRLTIIKNGCGARTAAAAPGWRWGNAQSEFVKLREVRRLCPTAVNAEMGELDDVASHFGGGGTGIDIYRIQNSQYLLFSISHDGGD